MTKVVLDNQSLFSRQCQPKLAFMPMPAEALLHTSQSSPSCQCHPKLAFVSLPVKAYLHASTNG
ncbi:hypothetical protein Taro_005252 [Colocasia esculenta]|uniref:Uncharacterized protein n=1 Tax=Colocasia esculenta TaxID=4460 RepID=A0A843TRX3_COLES|nr:hypothetical protein [Colocasia esculenta]